IISFSDVPFIKLYPNPATDKITIESNYVNNKIEIYNNLGQNVCSCYSTDLTSEINVSEYPTGIYFVKVSNQNGKVTSIKFIKN
ncbi:MAG: T9SS type A sorting domain-containing protein, partial [Candidatus Shapirobacteria bacterium]|nr:T9SS type A sorting domain-containing protein [Candidatus Shapirobacteria bacterium]